MRSIRRKDKAITNAEEMKEILTTAKYVTVAMCRDDEPYLVTLSHGYDEERHCIYFHCAKEGKKVEILKANNLVWGQALVDDGYVQGACTHLYATTHFRGKVTFIEDMNEKEHALHLMIESLDDNPKKIIEKLFSSTSIQKVTIGRIDIDYISGKKTDKIFVSL
jgi:hypothetical protein